MLRRLPTFSGKNMSTYLIYKCEYCGKTFRGAESDLALEEVVHGIHEGWYDKQRLHTCVEDRAFGIANLAGVENID